MRHLPPIIDCETAPLPDAARWLPPLQAPANYTKPESIAKWEEENRPGWLDKAALDPWAGRVVATGLIRANEDIWTATVESGAEADVLTELWQLLIADTTSTKMVGGFNVRAFDLPFLIIRSTLLGVKVPLRLDLDRYRGNVLDLADVLQFDRAQRLRSLEFYARRFGVIGEDEPTTSGAMVPQWVAEGRYDLVRAHLEADLRMTRGLAEKLNAGELLK